MTDLHDLIGRNVGRIRQERAMSLGELARRSRLAKQTLATMEKGMGNPTVDTLASIAIALDVSLRRLLTEGGATVVLQRAAQGEWHPADGWRIRTLDEVYGSGLVRTAVMRADHLTDRPGSVSAHAAGTLHHVYVLAGRLRTGPIDEPVDLEAGDFAQFPGDVTHVNLALSPDCEVHIVSTTPRPAQFGKVVARDGDRG